MKLNARELREVTEKDIQEKLVKIKRKPIFFILENVYDTYNVGGLFRLADAIGVSKMYLCGEMEIPPNHKIKKASIGTYKIVPWEYKQTAKEAITELREEYCVKHETLSNKEKLQVTCLPAGMASSELQVIAVEQNPKSVDYRQADYNLPLALILGNETSGVLSETLELADQIVEIPMWGVNKSLNVIVSAAIVSYWVMSKIS